MSFLLLLPLSFANTANEPFWTVPKCPGSGEDERDASPHKKVAEGLIEIECLKYSNDKKLLISNQNV